MSERTKETSVKNQILSQLNSSVDSAVTPKLINFKNNLAEKDNFHSMSSTLDLPFINSNYHRNHSKQPEKVPIQPYED